MIEHLGTVFVRSSYSNGVGKPHDWAEQLRAIDAPAASMCEFNSLATFVSGYESFTENHVKYFPSIELTYKEEMHKKFSDFRVVAIAHDKKSYQSLIKLSNEAHRKFFYRVPTVTLELLKDIYSECGESSFTLCIPMDSFPGTGVLTVGAELNDLELVKQGVSEIEKFTSIGLPVRLVINPLSNRVFKTKELLTSLIMASEEGILPDTEFLVSNIASFYDQKSEESVYLNQKMKKMPNYPQYSPLLNGAAVVSNLKRVMTDPFFTEERANLVKEWLKSHAKFSKNLDFKFKINDYMMPKIQDGMSDEDEIKAFEKKVVDGWNKYVEKWRKEKKGEFEEGARAYRGNWGDENDVIVSSLDDIFNIDSKRAQRVKYEYDVIAKMGFLGYFLIVEDITTYADKKRLQRNNAGRGSAAGCLISYILGITGVDPIDSEYYDDLLFERFLNPSRISMPDIDLDFAPKSRDKIIRYLKKKYGKDRIVVIGAYSSNSIKPVIKDYHRANDGYIPKNGANRSGFHIKTEDCIKYSSAQINKITTSTSAVKQTQSFDDIIAESCETSTLFDEFYNNHSEWINDYVKPLCDSLRGDKGIHASGYLILPDTVDNCLPIRFEKNNPNGNMISHYEMEECEKAGYVKVDCLNVRSVGMISRMVELVEERTGKPLPDINSVDLNDASTIAELKKDSYGVFQFKSKIQREYLPELDPETFHHLYDSVSLLRTGPMQADAHNEYIKLKRGEKQEEYEHPSMVDSLKSTKGLIIYQEQVMRLAQDMAGFDLAEADNLRKAIGKKKQEILDKYKEQFIEGCYNKNNIEREVAERVWEKINFFAGYGFNMCVTGDTMLTFPIVEEHESSKPDSLKKNFVHIPVKWLYEAYNADKFYNQGLDYADQFFTDYNKNIPRERFVSRLKNDFSLDHGFNFSEKMIAKTGKFRDSKQNLGQTPEIKRLIHTLESKTLGSIISFDDEQHIGYPNNIVHIKKLESKAPIVKITTALNGLELKGGPTHRVTIWDRKLWDYRDVPMAELKVGDYVLCADFLTAENDRKTPTRDRGKSFSPSSYKNSEAWRKEVGIFKEGLEEEGLGDLAKAEAPFFKRAIKPYAVDYKNPYMDISQKNEEYYSWEEYGIPVYADRIVSVDVEQTPDYLYEIQMKKPVHRYFSNGIVSHNSHAVSYSILGYYMAWIKARYPNEYWCGVMTFAPTDKKMSNNIYELETHLQRIGINIEYPNFKNFVTEYRPIYGKNSVTIGWPIQNFSGLGEKTGKALYEFCKDKEFNTPEEFIKAVYEEDTKLLDLKTFKILVSGGFFDEGVDPRNIIGICKQRKAAVDFYFDISKRSGKKAQEIQRADIISRFRKKSTMFFDMYEKLKVFKYPAKTYFKFHDSVMDYLEYENTLIDERVMVGGVVEDFRLHIDKNNNKMCFLNLVDKGEAYNVVVFAKAFEKVEFNIGRLKDGDVIQVVGKKNRNDYGESVLVDESGEIALVFRGEAK